MNEFKKGVEKILERRAGAGGADGAARPVGQLLQPPRRQGAR